jgi:energy-coupling factor transporter ATP-binding protein EcfA2
MFDHDVPKPINQLSKGQVATALLPLILRPAPYPLIFDQPEDDLDNSFIFETLVSSLRHLKADRQLIFVTHNANIPVLGEADDVIVMEMATPRTARAPDHGSVDEMKEQILRLLEGGAEAFRSRQQRYHSLLNG